MTVRLHCAGAARQTLYPTDHAKVWSAVTDREGTVVAIAEAGELAFDLPRFNRLSRAVTDALVMPDSAAPWHRASDCLRARRAELGDDWEVAVYASAIRLHATTDAVGVSWLGGLQAMLVRAGAVLDRTLPHTPDGERRRRGWPPAPNRDGTGFVLMRCLSLQEEPVPEEAAWRVQSGDRIVVMSSCLAHRRSEDRVRRAARRPSPSAAAADLLEDEAGGDPSVGCAVVVVDVGEA